jgi:hypothetical protein
VSFGQSSPEAVDGASPHGEHKVIGSAALLYQVGELIKIVRNGDFEVWSQRSNALGEGVAANARNCLFSGRINRSQ